MLPLVFDFLGFEKQDTLIAHLKHYGLSLTRSHFPLTADNGLASIAMARAGLGVGILIADDAELFPELEQIWPDFGPVEVPIWLVTHRELHTSKRIRLVFDLIADRLGGP